MTTLQIARERTAADYFGLALSLAAPVSMLSLPWWGYQLAMLLH
jgi:hypothetical protein